MIQNEQNGFAAVKSFKAQQRCSFISLHVAFFALALLATGCATHVFKVQSDPIEASVYVVTEKGEKKAIGKTPLEMPMSEVRTAIGDEKASGEFFVIGVEKQGFESQTLTLPAGRFGTLVTDLDVKMKKGELPKEEKIAKTILDRIFLAQKFAISQQFERAQIELDKILVDFPGFSRALSMRASIHFAQKNYSESLRWYEEALKVDPQMEDAVKMAAKVRALAAGGRDPAATDPNKAKGP